MTGQIDITPEERAIVMQILNEIVPDREVRAFGSRVTGKAKTFSDFDLAIMGDEPLPLETRHGWKKLSQSQNCRGKWMFLTKH